MDRREMLTGAAKAVAVVAAAAGGCPWNDEPADIAWSNENWHREEDVRVRRFRLKDGRYVVLGDAGPRDKESGLVEAYWPDGSLVLTWTFLGRHHFKVEWNPRFDYPWIGRLIAAGPEGFGEYRLGRFVPLG